MSGTSQSTRQRVRADHRWQIADSNQEGPGTTRGLAVAAAAAGAGIELIVGQRQARPLDGIGDAIVHASKDHHAGGGNLKIEASRGGQVIDAVVRVLEFDLELPAGTEVRIPPSTLGPSRCCDSMRRSSARSMRPQRCRWASAALPIEDAQSKANGWRTLLCGVNRHEHLPRLGRVVPQDVAEAELRLVKQHNVNAIRTSHYPPGPDFLALADQLGFYVVLECHLATHGFESAGWVQNPRDDPQWEEALVDRMHRTVERDNNPPTGDYVVAGQ